MLTVGKKVAKFYVLFNVVFAVLYLLFACGLPPDHPLLKTMSVLPVQKFEQTVKHASQTLETKFGVYIGGKQLTAIGLVDMDPATALAIVINTVFHLLVGCNILLAKLAALIPFYGDVLMTILTPIMAFISASAWIYIIFCWKFKQC